MNALTRTGALAAATAVGALGALAATTVATAGDGRGSAYTVTARLSGYQEDPATISTTGAGSVRLRVDPGNQTIHYTLRWANLEGTMTQAHIHFGGRHQSGGISAFLCSNLGNGPAGTQACPTTNPAEVSGTLRAADVVGPTAQGITAGQVDELLRAIAADTTYVNVHSTLYPAGEIRSQLEPHGHR
jgi:hypothetical protein